jgi:hypothetical protein
MRAILLGLTLAAAALPARADQPFQSMDALARAAHAETAARYCEHLSPSSASRLATAQHIARATGVPLDTVLTQFHSVGEAALARITRDGCDDADVVAMRQFYHASEQRGFAGVR